MQGTFELVAHLHWGVVLQIALIDILLGGDNAVVIALACRKLDRKRRFLGILWGTIGAIILRVVLIAFALQLLAVPYLKLVGAVLLSWIGIKLLLPDDGHNHGVDGSSSILAAVRTIIVADFVMSLDNVIAISGAAQSSAPEHQILYVIFGLLFSIPIVVWGSTVVLKLIDRFPLTVFLGAGLLGWIAGGMLMADAALATWFSPLPESTRLIVKLAGALFVMGMGAWLARRQEVAGKAPT